MQFNSGLDPDNDQAAQPYTGSFGAWAGFGAAMMQSQRQGIGPTVGAAAEAQMAGGRQLSHDEAVSYWKSLGFDDASFIGQQGMTQGALDLAAHRQMEQLRYARMANQSGVDQGWHIPKAVPFIGGATPERNIAGFVGGLLDPVNAIFFPAAAETTAGKSLLMRGALAGSEGSIFGGVQNVVNRTAGRSVGDQQMTADEQLKNVLFGTTMGTMFGAARRGPVEGRVTTDDIVALERSGANAISPKGAAGIHQVMPETAREMGLQGTDAEIQEQLKNPEVSQRISQKYLDHLDRMFPNDPEAQAIAYNGGPGRAQRWLAAGRDDSILPKETQDYVARFRATHTEALQAAKPEEVTVDQMTPEQRTAAGRAALQQFATDAPINTEAFDYRINAHQIADEHDAEVSSLTTKGYNDAALQLPGSKFLPNDETEQRLQQMEVQQAPKPAVSPTGEQVHPEVAELNEHVNNAIEEAKLAAEHGGGRPEALAEMLSSSEKEPQPELGNLSHDDYAKAVKAAVQCAMQKGITYAD